MAPPTRYMQMVAASRDESSLAVRLFNDPAEVRSFEGFVVHMHLAWLYLLHAEFTRDGVDYRYWKQEGRRRRLEKVDGEPKRWELARCLRQRWPNDKDPVRANLAFFIALRNKIEHRYGRQQQALAAAVGGEAQALLLNYEQELVAEFGQEHSLATRLRFPVFIGSFTDEGERALRSLRRSLPKELRTFIADYQASLDPDVVRDLRYELRLRVYPEVANRPSRDVLAISFTGFDDLTEEERGVVESRGTILEKVRHRDVIAQGHLRPREVIAKVQAQIPFQFNQHHFVLAYKALGVRPAKDATDPAATMSQYCTYDALHRDYGYKAAFVTRLIGECATAEGFEKLLGTKPRPARPNEKTPGATS